jgi:hypothetical protein
MEGRSAREGLCASDWPVLVIGGDAKSVKPRTDVTRRRAELGD